MDGAVSANQRPATRTGTNPARLLVLALAGGVLLLAAVETFTALTASWRAPSETDWRLAAAEVRAGFKPGDLIVFAPAWSDQVGRQHLGDLIPPEMAARADEARYARIWEVSIRGARAPEALSDDALPASIHKHGKVRVTLYDRHHVTPPLYDFTANLAEARVVQTPGGEPWENPCLRDGDGIFKCSTTRVERRIMEVDYKPRRGVLVPIDGQLTTYLAWSDVPIGDRLIVYAGLHDYYARKNSDVPIRLRVKIGDEIVAEGSVKNDDGWKRFEIETTRFKGATGHAGVRFEVSAPSAPWRNVALHAETRNVPGPEAP